MNKSKLCFKIYSIAFLILFMILMCICVDGFPTISEAIVIHVPLFYFFVINMFIISVLFYAAYCLWDKGSIFHYLLFPSVLMLVVFDCERFRWLHYLGGLLYLCCVFAIIYTQYPPIVFLIFLILPVIAFGCLGIFEILFLIAVAILI